MESKKQKRKKTRSIGWTFLSNHAHVLLCLCYNPNLRIRELAKSVGITTRAVQRILGDLEKTGYLVVEKKGRTNYYTICGEKPLRHPLEAHQPVQKLLTLADGLGMGLQKSREKVETQ